MKIQKLYSIAILLFAFIYPSAIAEAKDSNVNNVLQTNLMEEDATPELLLAHRHHRRRYRNRRYKRHHYHRRMRHQRRYQRIRYRGQHYRHGQWQLVQDRRGRLMYDWRRY
ncbi:MAG: hypothetical protein KME59_07875 [Trichormus sp. ATA11-4-KO1]|jgi:hypothetical protein|nr:hypothetical protein [Trichormus sp. ATA11-4-KO1]